MYASVCVCRSKSRSDKGKKSVQTFSFKENLPSRGRWVCLVLGGKWSGHV